MQNSSKLNEKVFQFLEKDEKTEVKPLGMGHINDSYIVKSDGKEYLLQRINHNVFKNVPELQNNILRVTSHIRKKLEEQNVDDIDRKVLTLIPTKEDALYYKDEEGNYWRMMHFITDSKSYNAINPELAYRAGLAFGEFQSMLTDLPNGPLFETIPNFHNMEFRLEEFRAAVKANL